jgi:hypothetical protein
MSRVDKQGGPPLTERPDLGQGQRQGVGGESHRLGVEVAAGQGLAGLGEHQRIVGHRPGLDQQGAFGVTKQIEDRAHHLRLAAQAVGVLHPVAVIVAVANGAAVEQAAQDGRDCDLAGLAPGGMDARIKGDIAARRRVDAQGAGDQRRLEDAPGQRTAPSAPGRSRPGCR